MRGATGQSLSHKSIEEYSLATFIDGFVHSTR